MIDVKVLRAAGLTDVQIAVVVEMTAPLIAELEAAHEQAAVVREQNRKRKQNQRARHGDIKSRHGDMSRGHKKPNGINGHVTVTNGESSSFFFLEKERKKDSQNVTRTQSAQFYAAYPKKVGKLEVERAYARARRNATHDAIMAGLERYKRNLPERKFIPHPATWLNKGRWLDDPASLADQQPSPWKQEGMI